MRYPTLCRLAQPHRRIYRRGTIRTFQINGIPTPTETQPLAGGSLLRNRTPEQIRQNEVRIATEAFRKIRQITLNRKSPEQIRTILLK